jgi:transcriptional regulator with XRE-family HTH domain
MGGRSNAMIDVDEGRGPGGSTVSYSREVGERLRQVRIERSLSLQDVERQSGGRWKAAVIGSYERGDRNISATRLLELAEFYEVSPAEVLPGDPPAPGRGEGEGVMLDLERIAELDGRWAPVRRYLESIQVQRGDFNRRVLSVRADDLRALAVLYDAPQDDLVADLRSVGALAED